MFIQHALFAHAAHGECVYGEINLQELLAVCHLILKFGMNVVLIDKALEMSFYFVSNLLLLFNWLFVSLWEH